MDPTAYRQFLEFEREHWWFRSRRTLYFDLLERAVRKHLQTGADPRQLESLDVGCGMGGMLPDLRRFGEPNGIEIELEGVRVCRERGFERTMIGSGYGLPHRAASLDLVTLFDTIEHIEDDERVLREVERVLRPGGLLMISVPAYQFLYANNDRVAHHCRRYTRGELVRKAQSAGLEVMKATYVNTFLFPLILPAVLLIKLKERLFGVADGDDTTNLSYQLPRWLNRMLEGIFSSERFPLRHISFPVGHSLAFVARRPLP